MSQTEHLLAQLYPSEREREAMLQVRTVLAPLHAPIQKLVTASQACEENIEAFRAENIRLGEACAASLHELTRMASLKHIALQEVLVAEVEDLEAVVMEQREVIVKLDADLFREKALHGIAVGMAEAAEFEHSRFAAAAAEAAAARESKLAKAAAQQAALAAEELARQRAVTDAAMAARVAEHAAELMALRRAHAAELTERSAEISLRQEEIGTLRAQQKASHHRDACDRERLGARLSTLADENVALEQALQDERDALRAERAELVEQKRRELAAAHQDMKKLQAEHEANEAQLEARLETKEVQAARDAKAMRSRLAKMRSVQALALGGVGVPVQLNQGSRSTSRAALMPTRRLSMGESERQRAQSIRGRQKLYWEVLKAKMAVAE